METVKTQACVVENAPVPEDTAFLINQKGRQGRSRVIDSKNELLGVTFAISANAVGFRCEYPRWREPKPGRVK